MGRRKTQEEWDNEVGTLVLDEYTFLENYVNTSTKIKVIHNSCGHVYEVKPNVFLNGCRCPKCAKENRVMPTPSDRLTPVEWNQKVYDLIGTEYTFLDDYVNTKVKLKVRHNSCGNEYYINPSGFIKGSRCLVCSHEQGTKKHTKPQDVFDEEVLRLHNGAYTFLEPYVNTYTSLIVKHNICGETYRVAPRDFVKGTQCRSCVNKSRVKTQAQWDKEVYTLVQSEYTFLEDYVSDSTKISVRHNTCGMEYQVKPNNFLNGTRCPHCIESQGERLVASYLNMRDISYIPQKEFDDLRDRARLSYDFYIPSHNLLIEYQGEQHYHPVKYFGGKKTFKRQQKHDEMKRCYAIEKGYNLVEIHYKISTAVQIEQLLNSVIKG